MPVLALLRRSNDLSMLAQARALYALAEGLDLAYLYRRIIEESGNPAHLGLSEKP